MSTDEAKTLDELGDQDQELLERQLRGSLIANRQAPAGFNPKATAKRRAKNRVAARSRRANRSK